MELKTLPELNELHEELLKKSLAAAPDEGQAPDIFVVIGPLAAILADRRT